MVWYLHGLPATIEAERSQWNHTNDPISGGGKLSYLVRRGTLQDLSTLQNCYNSTQLSLVSKAVKHVMRRYCFLLFFAVITLSAIVCLYVVGCHDLQGWKYVLVFVSICVFCSSMINGALFLYGTSQYLEMVNARSQYLEMISAIRCPQNGPQSL